MSMNYRLNFENEEYPVEDIHIGLNAICACSYLDATTTYVQSS